MITRPTFSHKKRQYQNIPKICHKPSSNKTEPNNDQNSVDQAETLMMAKGRHNPQLCRFNSPPHPDHKGLPNEFSESRQPLSEQQIRNSAMYRILEQQIAILNSRQAQEVKKLTNMKEKKKKEIECQKRGQFGTKLQIWELKNQMFLLKDFISEEHNETERLIHEINQLQGQSEQEGEEDESEINSSHL